MEVPTNSHQDDKSKKKHICSTCGSSFTKRSDVIRHKRTHTGERPFKCDICVTFFSQASSLKIHLRKHTGERPFKCSYCDQTFGHSHRLKSHVAKFHSNTRLFCDICGLEFDCRSDLERHINTHSSTFKKTLNDDSKVKGAYPRNISCLDQQGENNNDEQSVSHNERCVSEKPGTVISNVLTGSLSRVGTTDKEIKLSSKSYSYSKIKGFMSGLESGPTYRSFMCEMCGSFYPDTASLECHHRKMHDDDDKPYGYGSSALKFDKASNSTNLKTSQYSKCQICGSSFALSRNLNIHMRIHTGEKPYTCEECGRNFAHSQGLKVHCRVHFYSNKMHVCKDCGVSYSSRKSFNQHLQRYSHCHKSNNPDKSVSPVFVIQKTSINKGLRLSTQVDFKQKRIENRNGQPTDIEKSKDDEAEEEECTNDKSTALSRDNGSPSTPPLFDSFPTFQDHYLSETEIISSSKPDEGTEYAPYVNNTNTHNESLSPSPGGQMTWKPADDSNFINCNLPQLKVKDTIETNINRENVKIVHDCSPGSPASVERGSKSEIIGEDFHFHIEEGREMEARGTQKIPSIDYEKQSIQKTPSMNGSVWVSDHTSSSDGILYSSLQMSDKFYVLSNSSLDPKYVSRPSSHQSENVNSSRSYIPNAVEESVIVISHSQSSPLTSSDFLLAIKGDVSVPGSSVNSVVKNLSVTSVNTADFGAWDRKIKKCEYSTDGSQSIETSAVFDEKGQNTYSEEINEIVNLEKSPTDEETITTVYEIMSQSSEDIIKDMSSISSNFVHHGRGSREGGGFPERIDRDNDGESVETQNQWERQEKEICPVTKRETKTMQEMETQLKCTNCPLGLFDASVISVLCEDECFGEMVERNLRSEEKNLVTSPDSTLRQEPASLLVGLVDEETSRTEQEHYFNEGSGVMNELGYKDSGTKFSSPLPDKEGKTKITSVATNALDIVIDEKSSSPMSFEFESVGNKNSSPVYQRVKSVPPLSQLVREQLDTTNRKQSQDRLLLTSTRESTSSVSESQLCFKLEMQGTNVVLSKDVGFRTTMEQEEQEANKIIVKRNEEAFDKVSSMRYQTRKGTVHRWAVTTVSKYKHNRRISNNTQKADDMFQQLQTKDRSFACNQCHASFYRLVRLRQHQRIHSNSKKRSRLCQICHSSFVFQNTLKRDLKLGFGKTNTSIKLLEISTAKTNKTSECLLMLGTNFSCLAKRDFSSDHIPQTVIDQKRVYLCQFCGESLPSLHKFNLHIKRHGGITSYSCNFCSVVFDKKSNLTKHELIHSGKRPYKCEVCSKGFTQRANLKVHMRIHTGERPFLCKLCSANFAHSQALKLHMRFHTKEARFVCPSCGKGFVVKAALEKHCLSHTGEKPYVCNICNTRLSSKSSLSRHAKKHKLGLGLLPHTCTVCSAHFAQAGHLKLHLKSNPRCQTSTGD